MSSYNSDLVFLIECVCDSPRMHEESNPEPIKLVRLVKLDKREESAGGIEAVHLDGDHMMIT